MVFQINPLNYGPLTAWMRSAFQAIEKFWVKVDIVMVMRVDFPRPYMSRHYSHIFTISDTYHHRSSHASKNNVLCQYTLFAVYLAMRWVTAITMIWVVGEALLAGNMWAWHKHLFLLYAHTISAILALVSISSPCNDMRAKVIRVTNVFASFLAKWSRWV